MLDPLAVDDHLHASRPAERRTHLVHAGLLAFDDGMVELRDALAGEKTVGEVDAPAIHDVLLLQRREHQLLLVHRILEAGHGPLAFQPLHAQHWVAADQHRQRFRGKPRLETLVRLQGHTGTPTGGFQSLAGSINGAQTGGCGIAGRGPFSPSNASPANPAPA